MSDATLESLGPHPGGAPAPERSFPPITEMAIATLALVIIGGIYLAAHLPRRAPLAPAFALVVAADLLLVVNVVILSRIKPFAWDRFFQVVGWALLAYLIIAGMLEYIFVLDGTRGATLTLLTLMLVTFGVVVPLNLGFSVARYQDVSQAAG
ncbi:MAG TPA: hypothetical protein VKG43_09970 [Acidimicrobiales bacterium]|nr:hypothetical protein [Acidimicrobiales bacterium]